MGLADGWHERRKAGVGHSGGLVSREPPAIFPSGQGDDHPLSLEDTERFETSLWVLCGAGWYRQPVSPTNVISMWMGAAKLRETAGHQLWLLEEGVGSLTQTPHLTRSLREGVRDDCGGQNEYVLTRLASVFPICSWCQFSL